MSSYSYGISSPSCSLYSRSSLSIYMPAFSYLLIQSIFLSSFQSFKNCLVFSLAFTISLDSSRGRLLIILRQANTDSILSYSTKPKALGSPLASVERFQLKRFPQHLKSLSRKSSETFLGILPMYSFLFSSMFKVLAGLSKSSAIDFYVGGGLSKIVEFGIYAMKDPIGAPVLPESACYRFYWANIPTGFIEY